MDGKLVIVTSSTGSYDTIYIGFVNREGDMLRLERASMVVRYESVGVSGIGTQPEYATRLRPSALPVWVPLCNVSSIVEADPKIWDSHLGVSRG